MPEIIVNVREKIAQVQGNPEIVCGNSDYTVTFDFDAEWNQYTEKTAHFAFVQDGKPQFYDVIFSCNTVKIPAVYRTSELAIGAYAGAICTTSPARVPCAYCITDGQPVHPDPPPDVYAQLLDLLDRLQNGRGALIHVTAIVNTFNHSAMVNMSESGG